MANLRLITYMGATHLVISLTKLLKIRYHALSQLQEASLIAGNNQVTKTIL